jgi:hypothetical protein
MILNNAPANEAIISNVGEIGEFRIRNSAKAFNILSSGLYANKIHTLQVAVMMCLLMYIFLIL